MKTDPTSLRLSVESLGLLDAWADHLAAKRNTERSRADVIELLLLRAAPPEGLGATESAIRRAHAALKATKAL